MTWPSKIASIFTAPTPGHEAHRERALPALLVNDAGPVQRDRLARRLMLRCHRVCKPPAPAVGRPPARTGRPRSRSSRRRSRRSRRGEGEHEGEQIRDRVMPTVSAASRGPSGEPRRRARRSAGRPGGRGAHAQHLERRRSVERVGHDGRRLVERERRAQARRRRRRRARRRRGAAAVQGGGGARGRRVGVGGERTMRGGVGEDAWTHVRDRARRSNDLLAQRRLATLMGIPRV